MHAVLERGDGDSLRSLEAAQQSLASTVSRLLSERDFFLHVHSESELRLQPAGTEDTSQRELKPAKQVEPLNDKHAVKTPKRAGNGHGTKQSKQRVLLDEKAAMSAKIASELRSLGISDTVYTTDLVDAQVSPMSSVRSCVGSQSENSLFADTLGAEAIDDV